ncbi:hypothetical protein Q3G72_015948 [Acer saccharum]|nr:hypothetical protein Q3G72_015948 [Acer saccharum]
MECKPVDHKWVVSVLGLEKSSSPESMESSDQGVSRKEDRWHEVTGEMIDRRGIQRMSGQRSRVGDRLGFQISHKENNFNRKFKSDGLLMDYGDSENEPNANCGDGPNLTFGLQEEGNQSSCGNGLVGSVTRNPNRNPTRKRAKSTENVIKQILVRNSDQRVVSLSDSEGRLMSLPLKSPIQLPLKDRLGGQISGKDFVEVPLAVEIEGMEQSEPQGFANKESLPKTKTAKCYWSLEKEITKVIEKGVALGHIVTSKANVRRQEQQSGVECLSNTGWNLEEEVTKVIEVAVALGFDFNGKEDEIGEQIARREMEDEERMREGNGK